MLKKRDLHEVPVLFELMSHPEVFPYVRQKATTSDEFYFITKQTIEAEERGELISRTILDEHYQPIGTINLFDIAEDYGFLATWVGRPYFGKGYNGLAKTQFFNELFNETYIQKILLKVRNTNARSLRAVQKLSYVEKANLLYPVLYEQINAESRYMYDLFVIHKESYLSYQQMTQLSHSQVTAT